MKNIMSIFKKSKTQKRKISKGICKFCDHEDEELLVPLFGVMVCEGCYYDLLNLMGYKKIDDMMDCDKKLLMKFLNELAEYWNDKNK